MSHISIKKRFVDRIASLVLFGVNARWEYASKQMHPLCRCADLVVRIIHVQASADVEMCDSKNGLSRVFVV